jgi:UTP--glucose-1-phosphate uridylyltransferase
VPLSHAVVPVAGLATRLLPLTKALPKALLPLAGRLVIDAVLAELAAGGCTRATIVAAPRDVELIARHVDPAPDLADVLRSRGRDALADAVLATSLEATVVAQPRPAGLADAVLCARAQVGDEPFVLALGDALLFRGDAEPATVVARLGTAVDDGAACAVAVEQVPRERVSSYGIVDIDDDGVVRGIVEKPAVADAPSTFAVAGRYGCSPALLSALDAAPLADDASVTAGIATLIDRGDRVVATPLRPGERRVDVGTLDGWRAALAEDLRRHAVTA